MIFNGDLSGAGDCGIDRIGDRSHGSAGDGTLRNLLVSSQFSFFLCLGIIYTHTQQYSASKHTHTTFVFRSVRDITLQSGGPP